MAATTKKGFDLREHDPFVADPVNHVFLNAAYPNGYTIDGDSDVAGWEVGGSYTYPAVVSDLDALVDPRVAGGAFLGFSFQVCSLRYNLLSAGTYRIWLALGNMSYPGNNGAMIQDTTSTLATIPSTLCAAGEFLDAAGTKHLTPAAWAAANAPRLCTFSTSICRIVLADNSANASIAHFAIQKVSPGGLLLAGADGLSGGFQ